MKSLIATLTMALVLLTGCKGKSYKMPSSSMETTIPTGSRFYVTSSDKFERNDLVVFDYYGDDYQSMPDEQGKFPQHWEERVCRLIAVSGDTVLIKDGNVFVNNKLVPDPVTVVNEYNLCSDQPLDLPVRGDEYTSVQYREGDSFCYRTMLTDEEVRQYQSRAGILKLKQVIAEHSTHIATTGLATYGDTCKWSVDNYGPVIIPSVGATIIVNDDNFMLYKNIPGITKGEQQLKEVLYFVLGDNRHMSQDSRYTGFISHSNMHGIVK